MQSYLQAPVNLTCEYLPNPVGIDESSPRLGWWVSDPRQGAIQSAWHVQAGSHPEANDLWDSGKVISDQSTHVLYAGSKLQSSQRVYWRVRTWDGQDVASPWSQTATFDMGLLETGDWHAKWIALPCEGKYPLCGPATYLRRTFRIDQPLRHARLYVTARGCYQPWINGEPASMDRMTPGWTDYSKRIRYQTYDVTERIRAGDNALGAILGDGWYVGEVAWERRTHIYGPYPQLLAQLELTLEDGTMQRIVTDDTWQARQDGPIVSQSFLHGETIDLRRQLVNWSLPGSLADGWRAVQTQERDRIKLEAYIGEPVRELTTLTPISVKQTPQGSCIFDLGQNMVGVIRLRIQGKTGQTLKLRHAEMLDASGLLYLDNLRGAKCEDTFICAADEPVVFEPLFTLHGFRYVEVQGLESEPALDMIEGLVIGSDTPETGSFSCSHEKLNQLQKNIVWGQRGNFVEVPTDCPQRDERLGWMGDAQVFIRTAAFNANIAPFFTRWMIDVADAQLPDGRIPHVVPDVLTLPDRGASGSPAWEDAVVICPWIAYRVYGDLRILERQYPAMERFIVSLVSRSNDGLHPGGGFGDWLSINSYTPMDLIGTAYSAWSCSLMVRIAELLGRAQDVARFEGYAKQMKQAFVHHFVTPAGRVVGDSQTAYLLALAFDLAEGELRQKMIGYLAADIESRGVLTTGFVGVNLLLPTLSEIGRDDLAMKLLTNEQYPSWLYSVNHGATTIWERWDGWTETSGFQTPDMNSFNHYAYGSCGQWMYARLAGLELDPDVPAYKRFHINPLPSPPHGVTSAAVTFDSLHGRISLAWQLKNQRLKLNVTIPANTSAILHQPDGSTKELAAGSHELSLGWPVE